MEKEIIACFELYCKHISPIIKTDFTYDFNSMTVEQIRTEMNIIHMKYILNSGYSLSNSISVAAHAHLKSLIDEHMAYKKICIIEHEYFVKKN